MGLRQDNFKKLWSNGKSRMVILTVVALTVVALIFAAVTARKAQQQAALPSAVPTPPALKSTPGLNAPSREYTDLQREENRRKAENAARAGGTALPSLIGRPGEAPMQLGQASQPAVAPQAQQARVRPYTQQEITAYQTGRDAALAAMQGQFSDLKGSLGLSGHEVIRFATATQPPAAPAAAQPGPASPTGAAAGPKLIVQAGTLSFGVLDTDINSDEPGPVMSTIVDGGPLDKAVLLGTMTRTNERVLVHYTTMRPVKGKTVTIDAYAVDQETARNALATGVDRHYLLRYGSLFASSFAAGYGQAYSQSGSSVVTNAGGTTVTTQPATSKQALAAGLSAVGQAWSSSVGQNFNTPPTVTVATGTPIGILFMQDAVQEPGEGAVTKPATPTQPLAIPGLPVPSAPLPAPAAAAPAAQTGYPLGSGTSFYPAQPATR